MANANEQAQSWWCRERSSVANATPRRKTPDWVALLTPAAPLMMASAESGDKHHGRRRAPAYPILSLRDWRTSNLESLLNAALERHNPLFAAYHDIGVNVVSTCLTIRNPMWQWAHLCPRPRRITAFSRHLGMLPAISAEVEAAQKVEPLRPSGRSP